MKIPPRRRKTAFSSLRRIANRIGVRFTARRTYSDETGLVPPVEPPTRE